MPRHILTRQSHRGRVSTMEVIPPPMRPVKADSDHNIVVSTVDLVAGWPTTDPS